MKSSHFKTIALLTFATLLFTGCGTTFTKQTQQTPVKQTTSTVGIATQNPTIPDIAQPATTPTAVSAQTAATLIYNSTEVSKHNNVNDCWIIIDSGVYNITSYIPQHPGGPQAVIRNCGKDGTNIFNLKHSPDKKQYLTPYFLANLDK